MPRDSEPVRPPNSTSFQRVLAPPAYVISHFVIVLAHFAVLRAFLAGESSVLMAFRIPSTISVHPDDFIFCLQRM